MIRAMIVCILATFVFVGCSTGESARTHTNPQGGTTTLGDVKSFNSEKDMVLGDHTTINNNYGGLNEAQLRDELQKRDKRLADLEAESMKSKPRTLDTQMGAQLETLLTGGKPVTVTTILGDSEAFQFAEQIKHYLEGKGYNVSGVDQAVYSQPVVGLHIEPQGDSFAVIVGRKQP